MADSTYSGDAAEPWWAPWYRDLLEGLERKGYSPGVQRLARHALFEFVADWPDDPDKLREFVLGDDC